MKHCTICWCHQLQTYILLCQTVWPMKNWELVLSTGLASDKLRFCYVTQYGQWDFVVSPVVSNDKLRFCYVTWCGQWQTEILLFHPVWPIRFYCVNLCRQRQNWYFVGSPGVAIDKLRFCYVTWCGQCNFVVSSGLANDKLRFCYVTCCCKLQTEILLCHIVWPMTNWDFVILASLAHF